MNTKVMFSSEKQDWGTPQYFFDILNAEFNFTLDACADQTNHKCEKYYTISQDGLSKSWAGERVFCNPPYGNQIEKWVKKCAYSDAELVVMLVPARTDTKWFHNYIYGSAEIRFIRGRLKFDGAKYNAPFPSMVVIFRNIISKE